MMEVKLKLKVPDHWVEEISEKYGTPIKILDVVPDKDGGTRELIEIENKEGRLGDDIVADIKRHPLVTRVDTAEADGKIIGSIFTKCATCNTLTGANCFIKSAISSVDGTVEWDLITADKPSLAAVLNGFKATGCEVELKKVAKITSEELLTDRQKEILKMAYERGYFDTPKRVSIRELAKLADVSISTLSEIIRKGEKKIVNQFLSQL